MSDYPLFEIIDKAWADRDICQHNHRGNPESEAAHESTKHRKIEDCRRIVDYIKQHGPQTCFELSQALGMPYQTASGRCADLRYKLKQIEPNGQQRPTGTGSMAAVLRLKA